MHSPSLNEIRAAEEIERLEQAWITVQNENNRLHAEIERLRAELKECEVALDKAGLSRLR